MNSRQKNSLKNIKANLKQATDCIAVEFAEFLIEQHYAETEADKFESDYRQFKQKVFNSLDESFTSAINEFDKAFYDGT